MLFKGQLRLEQRYVNVSYDGGGGDGAIMARADLGEGLWLASYNSLWFWGRRSWPAPHLLPPPQIRADAEG